MKTEIYNGAKLVFLDKKFENINFETNSGLRKIINFFLTPILNILPAHAQKFVRKSHKGANEVIEYATTHRAIERLYNPGKPHQNDSFVEKITHKIWFYVNNSKAIRNRLRLVELKLRGLINLSLKNSDYVSILSIASGSARAVLESLPLDKVTKKCKIRFLDKSPHAITYSKELARPYIGICDINWINDTANNFTKYYPEDESIDIIEMVGLLDYFEDDQVIKIFRTIYMKLKKGAFIIKENINDNSERPFITKVVGWDMMYRDAKKMIDLGIKSGFSPENIEAFYEPLQIHAVLVMKK